MNVPIRAAAILLLLGEIGAGAGAGEPSRGPSVGAGVVGAGVSASVPTPSFGVVAAGPICRPSPPCTINYAPPIVYVPGPFGWTPYAPPLVVMAPGGSLPPPVLLPPPPVLVGAEPPAPPQPVMPPRVAPRANPKRASQWLLMGDRQFRAKQYSHAVERYEQAIEHDPASAAPRARLAQVAIVRGQYREAVLRLREAQAAEPGWLAEADDVQALYPEPTEFAALVGRIETHLQAFPEDRDACLVLGALWYLSGRTEQAADVLQRLTDREPDPMLAALLTAARVEAP